MLSLFQRRSAKKQSRRAHLSLEHLETRMVPATISVNTTADLLTPPSGVVSLRSAIQQANQATTATTINLTTPGNYQITRLGILNEIDNNAGEFSYTGTQNLTIINASGGQVAVNGGGLNRVFDVNPAAAATPFTVTFQGLTIENGSAAPGDGADGSGGGIRAQGGANIVLNGITLANNRATADGAGITLEGGTSTGTLTINGSAFLNNHTGDAGGAIDVDGTGLITVNPGCVFTGNTCVNQGAAIWLDGGNSPLIMTGDLIEGNSAFAGATGAIGNAGNGAVTLIGCTVENNFSGTTGAGFGDENMLGNVTIADCLFLNNVALTGGGAIQAGGPGTTTVITNTVIENNSAGTVGGGIFATGGTVIVSNCRIDNNNAVTGGGIEVMPPVVNNVQQTVSLTVSFCTIENNQAVGANDSMAATGGGGLDIQAGATNVLVTNSLFLRNTSSNGTFGDGGAINDNAGPLTLTNSQFTGNVASNAGGALFFNGSTLTGTGSTFNGNWTYGTGGAIDFEGTGTGSTLVNNTIALNSALNGGGLFVGANGLTLVNNTINANIAQMAGGGINVATGITLTVENTIVALDSAGTTGPDVSDAAAADIVDNGGNWIGTLNGSNGFSNGVKTGNPNLGLLQNNGGKFAGASYNRQIVQTEALQFTSSAIGGGVLAGAPTVDERGFPRPNGHSSIGAYEPQFQSNFTANQIFVESLYEVLLNRPADPGSAFWVGQLNNKVSPTNVILAIESSTEYRTDLLNSLYQQYLDRNVDMGGLQYFLGQLGKGMTIEQVESALVGSAEYFQNHGSNNNTYLQFAYETVLGRQPDNGGLSYFTEEMATGASIGTVANQLFGSQEFQGEMINTDYQNLLGRSAGADDEAYFEGLMKSGSNDQTVLAILLGSGEGYANHT